MPKRKRLKISPHPPAYIKRKSFTNLVHLLFKLHVTDYQNIPAVSNPYHLENIRKLLAFFNRKYPPIR